MFVTKKRFEELEKKVGENPELAECEKCGCMVIKKNLTKGKSVVDTKPVGYFFMLIRKEEYVREVFYCKRCNPKFKKKKKKKKKK